MSDTITSAFFSVRSKSLTPTNTQRERNYTLPLEIRCIKDFVGIFLNQDSCPLGQKATVVGDSLKGLLPLAFTLPGILVRL